MQKLFFFFSSFFFTAFSVPAQHASTQKMQWFADAKLGIFIHWGIYSVNGISESWSFFNDYINYADYRRQLRGFTAQHYQPQQWVNLIKESGARYAVITSKHHDGVALWNSKQADALTIPAHSAAKKDVLTPFVSALKKSGLKTGIYFSLPDWSYRDYDVFTRNITRYDMTKEPHRFDKFVNYYQGQLREICTQYNPDLLWFDGDWEHSAAQWKAAQTKSLLRRFNPDIIINSRLKDHGDYDTPEQGVPVEKPTSTYWELCYTMNDSWGYQPFDNNYKTSYMLIRTLVDCIAMGGNLLLDIGPTADGTIPAEQIEILKNIGRWTKKHAEAIYETQSGIAQRHFSGKSALSKNNQTLYLYLENDANGLVPLRGIKTPIKNISVIGSPQNIPFAKEKNTYWINISGAQKDKDITVLKVEFDAPLQLAPNDSVAPDLSSCNYFDKKNHDTKKMIATICHDAASGKNCFSKEPLIMNRQDENHFIQSAPKTVKDWIVKHSEALSNTGKGLSDGHYAGLSAISNDRQTIYLFVEGHPNGPIALKGIENAIARIRIVGDGTLLNHRTFDKLYWSSTPGIVYIDVPKERLDKNVTVIAVLLDGAIREHRREVKAVESNF